MNKNVTKRKRCGTIVVVHWNKKQTSQRIWWKESRYYKLFSHRNRGFVGWEKSLIHDQTVNCAVTQASVWTQHQEAAADLITACDARSCFWKIYWITDSLVLLCCIWLVSRGSGWDASGLWTRGCGHRLGWSKEAWEGHCHSLGLGNNASLCLGCFSLRSSHTELPTKIRSGCVRPPRPPPAWVSGDTSSVRGCFSVWLWLWWKIWWLLKNSSFRCCTWGLNNHIDSWLIFSVGDGFESASCVDWHHPGDSSFHCCPRCLFLSEQYALLHCSLQNSDCSCNRANDGSVQCHALPLQATWFAVWNWRYFCSTKKGKKQFCWWHWVKNKSERTWLHFCAKEWCWKRNFYQHADSAKCSGN